MRYIHQKINQQVFRKPVAVMDNVMRVTTHLRHRLVEEGARDVTRKALTVVPARDGPSYYHDGNGDYWRTFVFVERSQTFESVQSPRQAYEAGRAFGRFQQLLVDLPGKRLHETIPHFHNTRRRFAGQEPPSCVEGMALLLAAIPLISPVAWKPHLVCLILPGFLAGRLLLVPGRHRLLLGGGLVLTGLGGRLLLGRTLADGLLVWGGTTLGLILLFAGLALAPRLSACALPAPAEEPYPGAR